MFCAKIPIQKMSTVYIITMMILLVVTFSIVMFRFVRLLIKEGTMRKLYIFAMLTASIIILLVFLVTTINKINCNNTQQSIQVLNKQGNIFNYTQQKNILIPNQLYCSLSIY